MIPATIEAYVAAVRSELRLPPGAPELTELRAQLHELALSSTEADACARLGDPAVYAESLRRQPAHDEPPTIFGMPNTLGRPARDGWRSMFDPSNPKILIPKVRGVGWTVNFGALAVKLHLIRPDDVDDDVLGRIRAADILVAAAVPAALALVGFGLAAWGVTHRDTVPTHWGWSGAPDAWSRAFLALVGTAGAGVGVALLNGALTAWWAARRRPEAALMATGVATFVTSLITVSVALMLAGDHAVGWLMLPAILVGSVLATVVAYHPVRAALRRVWRRPQEHA